MNLITTVKEKDAGMNYFWYDAQQRRYAIQDSDGLAYFTYDRDGLCTILERDASGSVVAEHARGYAPTPGIGDMAAARISKSGVTYYQYRAYDDRGNTIRIVDENGAVTGSFEYDAHGRLLRDEPPVEGTRFNFSGPAWIKIGTRYITPTRVYEPEIGRFLQRDPIGFRGGINLYRAYFVPGGTDATGLWQNAPVTVTPIAAGTTCNSCYAAGKSPAWPSAGHWQWITNATWTLVAIFPSEVLGHAAQLPGAVMGGVTEAKCIYVAPYRDSWHCCVAGTRRVVWGPIKFRMISVKTVDPELGAHQALKLSVVIYIPVGYGQTIPVAEFGAVYYWAKTSDPSNLLSTFCVSTLPPSASALGSPIREAPTMPSGSSKARRPRRPVSQRWFWLF